MGAERERGREVGAVGLARVALRPCTRAPSTAGDDGDDGDGLGLGFGVDLGLSLGRSSGRYDALDAGGRRVGDQGPLGPLGRFVAAPPPDLVLLPVPPNFARPDTRSLWVSDLFVGARERATDEVGDDPRDSSRYDEAKKIRRRPPPKGVGEPAAAGDKATVQGTDRASRVGLRARPRSRFRLQAGVSAVEGTLGERGGVGRGLDPRYAGVGPPRGRRLSGGYPS